MRLPGRRRTILVILVHWNRPEETIRCVQSLRETGYEELEVLIVDNASQPSAQRVLERGLTAVRIVQAGRNLGYAGGFNLGVRAGRTTGDPDYVWLLNNDTTVGPDCPVQLVRAAEHLGPALLSPKILMQEEPSRLWFAGGSLDRHLKSHHIGRGEPDGPRYSQGGCIPWGSGCSLFLSTGALDRIGPMPEHYFLYLEDVDWCLQAARMGVPVYYVPEARVYHGVSRSVELLDPRAVTYYGWRNYYLMAARHGRMAQKAFAWWDLATRLVKTGVKLSLLDAARRDPHYLARSRALLDALRGRTGPAPFGEPVQASAREPAAVV